MPTFHHDGIDFYYETIGQGLPVVFCHGLTGDHQQPAKLFTPLNAHQLIVWDARAHGRTEPLGPVDKLNFKIFANDLRALLDHLHLDRVILGGISMGAGVATRFAYHWPDRVDRLILVRPAWWDQPWPENLAFVRTIAELIDTGDLSDAKQAFVSTTAYHRLRRTDRRAADAAMSYFDSAKALEYNARLWHIPASVPLELWQRPCDILNPTIVIGCPDDPAHPQAMAEQWAITLQSAVLHTVASAICDRSTYEVHLRQLVGEMA